MRRKNKAYLFGGGNNLRIINVIRKVYANTNAKTENI